MKGTVATFLLPALTVWIVAALAGCGSGSGSTSAGGPLRHRRQGPRPAHRNPDPGMGSRITKIVVARRTGRQRGRLPGVQANGASGCVDLEGRPEISIRSDVSVPRCLRVTPTERLLVVNGTAAYRRSEGRPYTVSLGPFSARLLPGEGALFEPLGRFLDRGLHSVGGSSILVEPADCAIARPGPGQPLCFRRDRPERLRRWRRTVARLGPPCRGSDLGITAERHSLIGPVGRKYTQLHVTNLSRRPCTVAGVPKVVALDRGGGIIAVGEPRRYERTGDGTGEQILLEGIGDSKGARLRLRLEAGRSATFTVAHYEGIGAGPCGQASVYGLRVTIPGTGPTRLVRPPIGYCPKPNAGLILRVSRIE
jgi:hypothetical protein